MTRTVSFIKIFLILFVLIGFIGCEYITGPQDKSDTTGKYVWKKAKFTEGSILSQRKDLTYDNGEIVATVDSGKGGWPRLNLSCGNIGMQNPATGISIDIYLNDNIETAGIQWWRENPKEANRFYWIFINRYGCLNIHKTDNTLSSNREQGLKYILKKDTGIDISKYNNLTVCQNKTGDMEVYLNKKLMYTVKNEDLMYQTGNFFIVYQEVPDQVYTKDNAGKARFRLKKAQYLQK